MDTIWGSAALSDALVAAGRAKYLGLAQFIRQSIGPNLAPTDRLPPVRDLAFQIGVTPGTVARAYGVLIDEGLLEAGVGRGTFVARGRRAIVMPNPGPDVDGMLDLLSPKLPECGQADLLRGALAAAARHVADADMLRYPSRATDLAARIAFADMIQAAPVGAFSAEDVVVSHGGQAAIMLILQTILRGDAPVVLVDELCYGGFRRASEMLRARVVGVPWDAQGPVPGALEKLAKAHQAQVFLTSSEVSNPMGRGVSLVRRQAVADIAAELGLNIVDDDCYRNGPFAGPSYRALLPDLGWYVTSPSKSLTAALRIGFVIPPVQHSADLARNAVSASFGVSRFLTDAFVHLAQHPDREDVSIQIRAGVNALIAVMRDHLGQFALTTRPDLPFGWLDLPAGWRAGAFVDAARAVGVLIRSADDFALRDGRAVQAVRIAINGQTGPERFGAGLAALARLLRQPPQDISV